MGRPRRPSHGPAPIRPCAHACFAARGRQENDKSWKHEGHDGLLSRLSVVTPSCPSCFQLFETAASRGGAEPRRDVGTLGGFSGALLRFNLSQSQAPLPV